MDINDKWIIGNRLCRWMRENISFKFTVLFYNHNMSTGFVYFKCLLKQIYEILSKNYLGNLRKHKHKMDTDTNG